MDSPLGVPGHLRAVSWSSFALRYAFAFTGVPDPPKFVLLQHVLWGNKIPGMLSSICSCGSYKRNKVTTIDYTWHEL
jgi:hypothetical protein